MSLAYGMSIWLQKSYLKFLSGAASLSSVVPQAFGALELKGPLYMTSNLIVCLICLI